MGCFYRRWLWFVEREKEREDGMVRCGRGSNGRRWEGRGWHSSE